MALVISAIVTFWVGYLIYKKFKPQPVLFMGGMVLMYLAVILGYGQILGAKATTGCSFFDAFEFIRRTMSSNAAKLGLNIMSVGAFARYMDKIKIMKENLLRISKEKGGYDFETQIWNDFLCLTVLHVKGGIYKKKQAPYKEHQADMKAICHDPDVQHALKVYDMPRLTMAEKLFLFFMKHHMYLPIFLAVRIYFR